jgi:hypothetical protein
MKTDATSMPVLHTPLCPFGTVVAAIDSLDRWRLLSQTRSSTHLKGGDRPNSTLFDMKTERFHIAFHVVHKLQNSLEDDPR